MRVKYSNIVLICYMIGLISFLFLSCHEITSQQIAAAMTILIILNIQPLFRSKGQFKIIVLLFLFYTVFEMLVSYRRYGQGWNSVFYVGGSLFSLILYLYFTGVNNKDKKDYFKIIIFFSRFLLISMYLVCIFEYFGVYILDDYAYRYKEGALRLNGGDFLIAIGMLLTIGKIIKCLNETNYFRINDLVWVILHGIYIILISQTRMMILALGVSCALSFVLCKKDFSKKVIALILLVVILLLFLNLPFVQSYLAHNFSGVISGEDSSIIPRLGAIPHYLEYGAKRNLFGWGFAEVSGSYEFAAPDSLFYVFHGPWGVYYTDDVGIFGSYLIWGLSGVVLYIAMLIKMVRVSLIEKCNNPFKLAITIFVVITTFSLSLLDVERQSYLVLVLLCMEMNIGGGKKHHESEIIES